MRSRASLVAVGLALAAVLFASSLASAAVTPTTWSVLSSPINPGQLTAMPWGENSYWLQPWRSSLVTRPATSLQDALGINFDVKPQEAMATARLLRNSGIRRARLEIPWNHMSYTNPSQLINPAGWAQYITAMRYYGIRPLILVNGDPKGPTPMLSLNLTLTAPAAKGATSVSLNSASAAQVVPGLTGIDVSGYAARVLITSVSGGVARLSQPLPASLAAGSVAATTFKYEPFAPPMLANGAPNPRFQQTLAGWLTYVKSVCQFVAGVYGSDNFDLEVWNENQAFMDERNYFNPVPDPGSTGSATNAVLQATIQLLSNPANGLTGVQVGDGFSNQSPWTSGTTVPTGTAAIDRHPYAQDNNVYPGSPTEAGIQPVNPLGLPVRAANGVIQQIFTPTFRAFFPEYPLSGIQTETLMRDLSSSILSNIQGTLHGATTHPAGSAPPAMWVTEDNLDQNVALGNGLPAADVPEFQAKAALRFYLAYASAGAQAVDLYGAAGGGCCQIIPQAFFSSVDANPSRYPASLAGPTMAAVARLSYLISDAQPVSQPRQLTLSSIAQYGNNSQFIGNGTLLFPNLYDRDVLAFFPFQLTPNVFVASVYVMTRDLTHYYTSQPAPGQTPFDLPAEAFQLTIGNVNAANASVWLYDPLTGTQQPAAIIARTANQIVVQLAATDSPRLLTISDGTAPALPAPAQRIRLTVPAKVPVATAAKSGIRVVVGCGLACPAQVMASPGSAGSASAVYARATANPTATGAVHLTLKLNAAGRTWLRRNSATSVRVTARNSLGAAVSKLVAITRPRAHGHARAHKR